MAVKSSQPLLEVKGLKTYFYTEDGVVKAVDGVDFRFILARCWPGGGIWLRQKRHLLFDHAPGRPSGQDYRGEILFENRDLLKFPKKK